MKNTGKIYIEFACVQKLGVLYFSRVLYTVKESIHSMVNPCVTTLADTQQIQYDAKDHIAVQ